MDNVAYNLSIHSDKLEDIYAYLDLILGEAESGGNQSGATLTDVLGFGVCRIEMEELTPNQYRWHYYAKVDGEDVCVAEQFGYDGPEAWSRDLDGDGVPELICNSTYGDGVESVIVYRNNNGIIEEGSIRQSNGILIKSAEALETAHIIDTVVLDKTGTITQGKPVVTDILCGTGIDRLRLLQTAASLEKLSEHPLADAITAEAGKAKLLLSPVEGFQQIPGQGIVGRVDGEMCLTGNRRMMDAHNITGGELLCSGETLAAEGKTPLFFAHAGKLMGVIAVADVVKPTSAQAIRELSSLGMTVPNAGASCCPPAPWTWRRP